MFMVAGMLSNFDFVQSASGVQETTRVREHIKSDPEAYTQFIFAEAVHRHAQDLHRKSISAQLEQPQCIDRSHTWLKSDTNDQQEHMCHFWLANGPQLLGMAGCML